MPLVTFHDAAGKPIQLMEVDGCYYPNIPHADQDKSVREAKDAIGRDDDVIFIAYPKSGSQGFSKDKTFFCLLSIYLPTFFLSCLTC